MTAAAVPAWPDWPDPAKLELWARLRRREWLCSRPECDGLPHDGWPVPHARTAQRAPDGDWQLWFIQAGRGAGKNRAAVEYVADYARRNPGARIALVGQTNKDVRDTMVEGESGLLSVIGEFELLGGSIDKGWNRSFADLTLTLWNGSIMRGFSSEKPRGLRGPQHHLFWGDEPATWEDARLGTAEDTTFSNLLLGLRLGDRAHGLLTGTPRPVKLIVELQDDANTVITRMRSYDNLHNLSANYREQVIARYEGTRLGRQELEGELIEDVEGALWTREVVESSRLGDDAMERVKFSRVVVGVDPTSGHGPSADDTGIIVAAASRGKCPCGQGHDHWFVVADRSCHLSPDGWGRRVVAAYRDFGADRVIAERNTGGEMVEHVVRTVDPNVSYRAVMARRSKYIRAEPIAALYEQGRVHHWGTFPELEDELCTWVPGDDSPDRLDALVWALTELSGGVGAGRGQALQVAMVGNDTGWGSRPR